MRMLPGFDLFYLVSPWTDSSAQVYAPRSVLLAPLPAPSTLAAHGQRELENTLDFSGANNFSPIPPEPASELCEPSGRRLILSRTQRNRKGKTAFCGARRVAPRFQLRYCSRGTDRCPGDGRVLLPFSSVEGRSRGGSSEAQRLAAHRVAGDGKRPLDLSGFQPSPD